MGESRTLSTAHASARAQLPGLAHWAVGAVPDRELVQVRCHVLHLRGFTVRQFTRNARRALRPVVRETSGVRFRALAITAGIALCVVGFSQAVHADEAALARLKAMQLCANCHGPQGLAALPRTPHLAGQDQDYLVEQLRQYRNGRRHHEVMSVIAKTLSDQDIVLTSSWYSSLRISVEDKN